MRRSASAREERAKPPGFARVVVHSVGVERVVLIAALKPGAREQALDRFQCPWLPLFEVRFISSARRTSSTTAANE